MAELHRLERILFRALQSGAKSFKELEDETNLPESSISRAALWLASKGFVGVKELRRTIISIGSEGERFIRLGLPERILVETLLKKHSMLLSEIEIASGLTKEELTLAIGWARRKGWIEVTREDDITVISACSHPEKGIDELLLERLDKGAVVLSQLPPLLRNQVSKLKERPGVLHLREEVDRVVELTSSGQNLAMGITVVAEEVSQLTPKLLLSGEWKDGVFRKYDIQAPVARVYPGKKQPFRRFLDDVKWKLVGMGFKEMAGPIVELMFFNCDALYMPQDHPAREIHDIYYVKRPTFASLEGYEKELSAVKATHENGWLTGSSGWGYKFSTSESNRVVLRSQGTAVSTRMLTSKDLEIPGKYFSISRCYRPDVVDRTHLTEFHHLEGIVIGEELTFRHLLGILDVFARSVAEAEEVKFRPDYFPFTEPSVELSAYRKELGWLEFGGAGIFRPEVTLPLGIKIPVIAWGLGVNRMFMMCNGIEDIRYIFSQDLDWLRGHKVT